MNEIKSESYYSQGLAAEKKRHYTKAIEFYLLASLEERENLLEIYDHLAFVLHRKKNYQASCDTFLFKEENSFFYDKNSKEVEAENREILAKEIDSKAILLASDWLALAQRAEELKCWNVAAHAYKEFLARNEKFDFALYIKLAYSYLQDKKYKEASFAIQEKRMRTSLKEFPLEERIIVYEGDGSLEHIERLNKIYLAFNQDVHFDRYEHIWISDKPEGIDISNTIVVDKESDLYRAYLARAKYLISTQSFDADFRRKPQQIFLFLGEERESTEVSHFLSESDSISEMIQELCFQNKKIAFELQNSDEELMKLYGSAIDDFNKKLWKSSYDKFVSVKEKSKDIVMELPTLYYIKESEARYTIENEDKKIEELLYSRHYRFTAESFVGIEYLLQKASKASLDNASNWGSLYLKFLEILTDIKSNKTKNIRSIADKDFLEKVYALSKLVDDALEAELLPYQVWFVFANLFIFARLYKKYQLAREKALASIVAVKETEDIDILRYKLNAFVEQKDIKNYTLLRDELMENSNEYIQNELSLIGSLDSYVNQQEKSVVFYQSFYNEDEKKFAQYIENKTVAIVGPVNSGLMLGEEIDAHDIVVRFNYNGLEPSLCDSIGSKTNVSFYISEILIPHRLDSDKVAKMNELDWIIFDKAHKKDSACFIGMRQNLRAGYFTADPSSNPYAKGTPSGIQRVILDLLRFKVAKIKVYNTNLFLQNKYDKNYKSRGALGADHFNFIWHDPLSNFIVLKTLSENSLIEADEVLNKILQLTPSAYTEALEERYGREKNDTE